jgi:hypothetical protein
MNGQHLCLWRDYKVAVHGGPKASPDGLVFSLDVANRKCISPLGCTGFNNAPQLVKNLISSSDTINSYNGVKLGNLNYYTAFAIDYPESSYGGDAVSRQGITPGYNVRSGAKTYDASRALHLWVWNNDTNSWIPDNYFNGFRLSGHCYDNYSGAENGYLVEIGLFISNYNTIKSTFQNCTYIVSGSHRADRYTSDLRTILYDLGMPTGYIDSDYIAAPEWILVGKPGLGSGNAYGWVYENYSTNPNQVAHLNFGLPIYGGTNNYLEFDGVDDYVNCGNLNLQQNFSLELWAYTSSNGSWYFGQGGFATNQGLHIGWYFYNNRGMIFGMYSNDLDTPSFNLQLNTWYHFVFTYNHSTFLKQFYSNGVLQNSGVGTQYSGSGQFNIGRSYSSGEGYMNGRISNTKIYNRVLTASEIQQNYIATKSRYGL